LTVAEEKRAREVREEDRKRCAEHEIPIEVSTKTVIVPLIHGEY